MTKFINNRCWWNDGGNLEKIKTGKCNKIGLKKTYKRLYTFVGGYDRMKSRRLLMEIPHRSVGLLVILAFSVSSDIALPFLILLDESLTSLLVLTMDNVFSMILDLNIEK